MKTTAAILLMTGSMALTSIGQQWPGPGGSTGVNSSGRGRATAIITIAEISGLIESQAELAGDAMVKFKGAKRRAIKAISDLEIENLSVKEKGISVSQSGGNEQQMMRNMMGGAGAAAPKPQVEVAEKLILVLSGIDKMSDIDRVNALARIIDAGSDAGLLFGSSGKMSMMEMQMGISKPPNIITYVSTDANSVTEKATKAAIAEAKSKAAKIAEISGVKLGKVVSVNTGSDQNQSYNQYNMWQVMFGMQQKDEEGETRLVSAVYQPIPVEVNIAMTFEIE